MASGITAVARLARSPRASGNAAILYGICLACDDCGMRPGPSDIARYRSNLQSEVDSAALYRAMQAAEKSPSPAEVYGRLAAVEERHAQFWRKRLQAAGAPGAQRGPGFVREDSCGWRGASGRRACCPRRRGHARALAEIAGRCNIQWNGALSRGWKAGTAIGAVTSTFTVRDAWFSGVRQLGIGAAAAVTCGAGHLFGVAVAG